VRVRFRDLEGREEASIFWSFVETTIAGPVLLDARMKVAFQCPHKCFNDDALSRGAASSECA
jgi:hypothetical protein